MQKTLRLLLGYLSALLYIFRDELITPVWSDIVLLSLVETKLEESSEKVSNILSTAFG